jgi:hypothetical protein
MRTFIILLASFAITQTSVKAGSEGSVAKEPEGSAGKESEGLVEEESEGLAGDEPDGPVGEAPAGPAREEPKGSTVMEPSRSATKDPQNLLGDELNSVIDLAKPHWARENVVRERAAITREDLERVMHIFDDSKNENSLEKSKVLLGEVAAPELYQIFQTEFCQTFKPIGPKKTHCVIIQAAFTMKARDAAGGIADFNKLRSTGHEFEMSSVDAPILTISPLYADKTGADFAFDVVKPFFEKYFTVKDFALVGLSILYMMNAIERIASVDCIESFLGGHDRESLKSFGFAIGKMTAYIPA